jgi:hypothetical protein
VAGASRSDHAALKPLRAGAEEQTLSALDSVLGRAAWRLPCSQGFGCGGRAQQYTHTERELLTRVVREVGTALQRMSRLSGQSVPPPGVDQGGVDVGQGRIEHPGEHDLDALAVALPGFQFDSSPGCIAISQERIQRAAGRLHLGDAGQSLLDVLSCGLLGMGPGLIQG